MCPFEEKDVCNYDKANPVETGLASSTLSFFFILSTMELEHSKKGEANLLHKERHRGHDSKYGTTHDSHLTSVPKLESQEYRQDVDDYVARSLL